MKYKLVDWRSFGTHLLGHVECATASHWILPVAAEYLTNYGVIWLFQTLQMSTNVTVSSPVVRKCNSEQSCCKEM